MSYIISLFADCLHTCVHHLAHEWVKRFAGVPELVDLLAVASDVHDNVILPQDHTDEFESYLPESEVQAGLKAGKLFQGVFRASKCVTVCCMTSLLLCSNMCAGRMGARRLCGVVARRLKSPSSSRGRT